MPTAVNGVGKNHKVQFTAVAILKREQPVTYRQYLERVVVYLNKIKIIYKHDTHFKGFVLFMAVGLLPKFPQQLCERLLCSFGMKETGMRFHYSLRDIGEPQDSGLAVTLPRLHSKNGI